MKIFILIFLIIILIKAQDYEDLLNEKVSEEFCQQVIGNLTTIIDSLYIYSDFIKAPKQPQGYENYTPQVDLINELNNINKKERTFLDFYRDIIKILDKARDGHFTFEALKTPNGNNISMFSYCTPFNYYIKKIYDDNGEVTDTYLTIHTSFGCDEQYTEETLLKIEELEEKKIISINNLPPYDYLEEMSLKFWPIHSPQARFIKLFNDISSLPIDTYPFKKEELNIKIVFENNETLEIEYQPTYESSDNEEYLKFFKAEKQKMHKYYFPLTVEDIKLKYKIKKGLIFQKEIPWDFTSTSQLIRCKVDETNKYNVIFQNGFRPDLEDLGDYEETMYQCFNEFYSNDFKIIVIVSMSPGGYVSFCIPFANYLQPKIEKPTYSALKPSNINNEFFIKYMDFMNPDTCVPFNDKDNFLEGEEDKYSEQVIHKKTKIFDELDIYYKLIMEKNKRQYISEGKTKKPTEIIVFTDGFSFSCASTLMTRLQVHGSAIVVGYNSRPDLDKKYFDASQSNSGVYPYENLEYVKNLNELGFQIQITNSEGFSPNDKNTPRTPYEFLVHPVDEISKIYRVYLDDIYDRIIKEADSIFKKYNDLENGECNPDNKFLYYETSECDSIINIDKAHGGYLCGSDKKWNKSHCIAAYCDKGYILNNERTKCEKSMCDEINM